MMNMQCIGCLVICFVAVLSALMFSLLSLVPVSALSYILLLIVDWLLYCDAMLLCWIR